MIIKPTVIDSCKNLCHLDLTNKLHFLPLESVNIGFAAEGMLSKLLLQDTATLMDVKLFKKQCVVFVVTVLQEMLDKPPLSNRIVRNASCFCPNKQL